ncbi:MAG: nucleoside transporter C-terminal domain-containing protein [Thermodesulfobacteriota bacterium]
MPETLQSALGFAALAIVSYLLSENRKLALSKTVFAALGLQLVLGALLLWLPAAQKLFAPINAAAMAVSRATEAGTSFVFGYVGGGEIPFMEKTPAASTYVLAFRGLFLLVVVSALSSLLFYWRVLPAVVRAFSWCLQKTLGVGGAEGLSAAANIFLGMIEAPLFIRPYIIKLNRGELFSVMTCGMATIAGTVMVLYANILNSVIPDAMGHILTASIISAPAAIAVAHLMVPGDPAVKTGAAKIELPRADSSMEAIANGTSQGVAMLINIIAMLVVLLALVALVNSILGFLPHGAGPAVTLQGILGYIMAPVVWLIGIPWDQCLTAGSLMGVKTILNELLAYLQMAGLPDGALSDRARLIMTYAMCGFANPGSLGIMLAGLSMLAPERKSEIARLGLKSIVAGTIATLMTGAVVGMFT